MVSGVTRGGAVTKRFKTPSVIVRRIGRKPPRSDEHFRTQSGAIIGKGFLRPTQENILRQGGIVGSAITPPVDALQKNREIIETQKVEQDKKNKISQVIQEKNKKLMQTRDVFQKNLIQQQTQLKINQINQSAIKLKQQIITFSKTQRGQTIIKKTKPIRIKLIQFFNNVSLGSVTESRLNNRDNKLNSDIEKFNKDFGGKELSEKEFNRAKKEETRLDNARKQIDKERDILENSFKRKFKSFLFGEKRTPLSNEGKNQRRGFIITNERKIAKLLRDKPRGYQIRILSIESSNKRWRREIDQGLKIQTGDLPIIPASSIPKGITSVRFLGKQKQLKNGRIVTDIIFKTSKGNIGIAKGVSVQKGSQGQSVVLGRFARKGVRFPSTKVKLGRVRSFVSVEKTTSKSVVKGNVERLLQKGIGRSGVVKGKKFFRTSIRFPSGKIQVRQIKSISFDDFASLSSVMKRGDLSIIIGNTITGRGAKSKFIGIIKGTSKVGKDVRFIGSLKQQYSKALQKVISVSASAIAQAEQTRGLGKVGVLASASKILSKSVRSPQIVRTSSRIKQVTRQPITQKVKQIQIQLTKIKPKTIKQKQKVKQIRKHLQKAKVLQVQKSRQIQKTRQLQRQLSKTRSKQKTTQLVRQIQKQTQKVKQLQKQIQVQISRAISILRSISIRPLKIIPIIFKIKTKKFKKKTLSKKVPVFFVKEKIRGKIKNLTPRPLTLRAAKDFLSYRLDNRLSRSGFFEPMGVSKNIVEVPIIMKGYFNKHRKKFRAFRIRVGKKKKIRNGFIERKKYIGDTKSEIRQLQASRKKRNKRRTNKKRLSPIERKKQRLISENLRLRKKIRNKKVRRKPIKRKKRRLVKRKKRK